MSEPVRLQLSQLGKGRKWAELAGTCGQVIPIVDDQGQEVALLIPSTEPITHELLDQLRQTWGDTVEEFRPLVGDTRWRYHRATNHFRFSP